jgi:hypothetical protein
MRRSLSSLFLVPACWAGFAAGAAGRVVLYPGLARVAGANGTAWRSDGVFHNPEASPQTIQLELLPRGSATVATSASLTLAVGETRQIDNLYGFLQASDGAGMLRVTGEAIAWIRTYNAGTTGSFGQDLAGVEPGGGYGPDEVVVFPFSTAPDVKTAFRSNMLLVNLEAAPITASLVAGGVVKTTAVPAGAYVQIDNLGAFLKTPAGFGTVRVTATGRWFAVVSTVDPVTGDPTTVRGLGVGETDVKLFAGVASLAGVNQTAWRSEAVLYNPADDPATATLELVPRGSTAVAASTTVTLAAGETRRLADVYQSLGAASGAGALRVSGGVLAWVRTFNQGAQGTFGQDLPPIDTAGAVGASVPVALPFRSAASIQTDFRSNLVVQNLESFDITLSLRAGSIETTQPVKALTYAQIDNLGAFLATPTGAGTVWVQADGRWAGTVSTIDPVTGDPTTLRDDRTYRPPTTYDLVDAALAAQTIDAEQALTDKVFSDFADPRLPSSLQGDDRNVREGNAVNDAASAFSTLSPATQDVIGPFLVPPFYEGSWWDLRRASSRGVRATTTSCRPWLVTCSLLSDWAYIDGAHTRIWYLTSHPGDATVAAELATAADTDIWPKFASSMGRVPKPDGGMGGSDGYDVVMTDGLGPHADGLTLRAGLTDLSACRDTAAFSYISRYIAKPEQRRATLAHEMFHGVQYAVPGSECLTSGSMNWLTESTAAWFEDYVYKDYNTEHDFAPAYLAHTDVSIDTGDGIPLRAYGAYVFFFYLTRVRGVAASVIGQIWNATASADSLHSLKAALAGAGADLDHSWPDFAAYAWNREHPFDTFRTLDKLFATAMPIPRRSGSLGAPSASWEIIPRTQLPLPHLSIHYVQYDFPDATASNVGFFNGLTRSLGKLTAEYYGDLYTSTELSTPEQNLGGHVTALKKIDGTWSKEDWTDLPARIFCRDLASERLQTLVVILSNASIETTSAVYVRGAYPPLLFASNVGCGPWQVDATLTYQWGDLVTEQMSVTGVLLDPISNGTYDANTPLFIDYHATAGGFAWSASGNDQGCSYSGAFSAPSTSAMSSFQVLPWILSGVGYRGISSLLFWEWLQPEFVLSEVCPQGSAMTLWNAAQFFLPAIPAYTWARVAPDGRSITIDASAIVEGRKLTGTWHLHAQRDP